MPQLMVLAVHVAPAVPVTPAPSSRQRLAPQCVVERRRPPLCLAEDVTNQLEDLLVTISGLGHAGQGGGGQALGPLLLHQLVLPLLGLRELGGDDHQAQVDHEERADLDGRRTALVILATSGCDSAEKNL